MQIQPIHSQVKRPAAPGLPAEERRELDQYTDRLRPEMGRLQTPPIGPPPPGLEAAKNYAEDVLLELAGKEFKARGMHVRVEVFSGDVPQVGMDDDEWQESNWREEHPGQTWPIRSWYGVPRDGRPLYRMTLNLGLLRNLETREELAFLLAQQAEKLLAQDAEDPINRHYYSPRRPNYLEPREMQAGSDRLGVRRMADAGYNPKGAFDALTRLYGKFAPEYPRKDLDRGLVAAAQGQEHEGLRMALVQTEVERLKRSGHPATAKALTPLPETLNIASAPLYEIDTENLPRFLSNYQALADELSGDAAPGWFFGEGQYPQAMRELWGTKASSADYEKALVATCEHLQGAAKTPQQRVDGFMRLLLAVDGKCLESFSPQGCQAIQGFLQANAGWDAGRFEASLWGPQGGSRCGTPCRPPQGGTRHHGFVEHVVFNETFQSFLPDSYHGLIARVPRFWSIDADTRQSDVHLLPKLLEKNHGEKAEGWPLAGALDDAFLAHLKTLDGAALAGTPGKFGLPDGLVLANELLDVEDLSPELQIRLDRALDTVQQPSAEAREALALSKLRPPFGEPTQLNGFLKGMFRSESWAPFSPSLEARLPALLLDQARTCSALPDLVYDEERPKGLEPALERRYARLVSQDRPALLRHITRNWVTEQRVSLHSPRRAWTAELARGLSKAELLEKPDLGQHDQLLRRTYLEGYQLQDSALPDTSMASLRALDERREARELEPKSEDFANDADYWKAVEAYWARCDAMEKTIAFVAPMESRLTLGKLALVGHDEQASAALAAQLNLGEFSHVLEGAEEAAERSRLEKRLTDRGGNERVGVDVGGFLLDGFLAVQSQITDLKSWYDLANRTLNVAPGTLDARVGSRRKLGDNFFPRLQALPAEELPFWLRHSRTLDLLSPSQASELLMKCAPADNPDKLAEQVADLDHEYRLRERYPLVFRAFRDDTAQRAKLQPSTVDQVFPRDEDDVDQMGPFKKQARALSGLLAMTRNRPPQDQLDTIEYLLGRQNRMPDFLEDAGESQDYAPLVESLRNTRQELAEADSNTRVLVANSFLAGPSGLLRTAEGKDVVLGHFLKGVSPDHMELARKVANAVLNSQGDADTLAVAYILGHKSKDDGQLGEAAILNRLFDAYGVPGIKMKQYLAFTSEFSDFKEAFESSQDAAMPLNYFEVLKLVQKRFGDDWPRDLKIDRILGSGSVNVAIRYRNEKTGKNEVVSLGREDIQEQTRYDFDRFQKFLAELTRTPEDKEKFGYILGLLGIIEDSVKLEFEKEAVKAVQQQAFATYKHHYQGWTVRSVDAYKVEHLGLFMEEAKGKTARKISEKDPALYKEAMKPMARAEMGVLRGQDSSGNLWPRKLFANPDFHDGQVLVDAPNKTVTILDFGQAVTIDDDQRKTALDILTVIGKGDSAKSAAGRLNKRFFGKNPLLSAADLAPILERKERMDIFIHLLSLLSQKGADVPISSVHWILGLNRQIALSERLGQPINSQVRHMVINHKLGLPLALYNTAHAVKEKLVQWGSALAGSLGGWALSEQAPPQESYAWRLQDELKSS